MSKQSLDEILVRMFSDAGVMLGSEGVVAIHTAAAAIVEAVERMIIGEDEMLLPAEGVADHWGLTEGSITRQMENGKILGKNELRASQRKAIKEWQ